MLVTIIVPIYNKDSYLENCIKDICNQTHEDIEILLINDGSIDSCEDIIKKWVTMDARIRYYFHENQGVAFTRNKGIELAKGRYIFFFDADDSIENFTIERLVNSANKSNADIVISNFMFKNDSNIRKNNTLEECVLNYKELYNSQTKYNMFYANGRPMSSVCNKLYKKEFLKEKNIEFDYNIISEDRLFNLKCYVNEPIISIINEYTYICNIVPDSRSRSYNINYYNESIGLFYKFYSYLENNNKFTIHNDLLQLTLINDIEKICSYVYSYSINKFYKLKTTIKQLKEEKKVYYILREVTKNNILKIIKKGNKKYFIYTLSFLFIYTPNSIVSLFFILYTNIMKIREKIKR